MTATATYTASMAAELKEPGHSTTMWHGYGDPLSASARYGGGGAGGIDSGPSSSSVTSPHLGRPRSGQQSSQGQGPSPYYARYPSDDTDGYDGRAQAQAHAQLHTHPHSQVPHPQAHTQTSHQATLASHHHQAFPSLKRTYSQVDQGGGYGGGAAAAAADIVVNDMARGGDGAKLSVGHDQKLLAFKLQEKHNIRDQRGRIHELQMSAQLHGMFFLSEMPSAQDVTGQAELTCYRRNLFQISGQLMTPKGQLSVIDEHSGHSVFVRSTEVSVSAIESVDNNAIRLVVIPWKTPPPNSPNNNPSPDSEPTPLPLVPSQDDNDDAIEGEYVAYPIGWRRLQFRVATANNGRRKELQQHFVVHLDVTATLDNGTKVCLAKMTTSPIVVRGRSPRNFQTRKEIPLLGSSAGSRGQALVETGVPVVASPVTMKPPDSRLPGLDLQVPPRGDFTFTAPKLPNGQIPTMRSNSFPTWNTQGHVPLSQGGGGASNDYSSASVASDSGYPKAPLSAGASFGAEPPELAPLLSPMGAVQMPMTVPNEQPIHPIRTQYAYAPSTNTHSPLSLSAPAPILNTSDNALSVPRYVDSNPRPAKSPRGPDLHSVHSAGSASHESPSEYRYGSYAPAPTEMGHSAYAPASSLAQPTTAQPQQQSREYYTPTAPSNVWAAAAAAATTTPTTATSAAAEVGSTMSSYAPPERSYSFPHSNNSYRTGSAQDPTSTSSKNDHHHQQSQHQQQHPTAAVYSAGSHPGTYDSLANYSWGAN